MKDLDNPISLAGPGFTSDLNRMHETPPYKMKKVDGIVSVDTRAYPKGIGVNLFIIPQNRHDLISKIILFPPTVTEAPFFLKCNPWIALVLYGEVFKDG